MAAPITDWRPEDAEFWEKTGKPIAWWTLWITTFSLILSFATWFVMSAVVVRLPGIGFKFSETELFWLTAMPGLAGGTLRLIHMFLIPIFGTRNVVTLATFAKILPCLGLGFAILNPGTPFLVFLFLAFLCGFGGGDFSRSICMAVGAAFDCDCNGATVGSVLGMMNGIKNIPEEWYSLFNNTLATTVKGFERMTFDELTAMTMKHSSLKHGRNLA